MEHDNPPHQPAEEITDIRIALIEFADTHTLDELITQALDRIEDLVDSASGFFCFLEAAQQTPSPQQGSTSLRPSAPGDR